MRTTPMSWLTCAAFSVTSSGAADERVAVEVASAFNAPEAMCGSTAAAGEEDIKEKLLAGHRAIERDYRVHLDGYNLLPFLRGDTTEPPRHAFFYWTDDGSLAALRYDRWKVVFQEQRAHGLQIWEEPPVALRFPKLFCLRTDPFERADHEAGDYARWRVDHAFALVPAQQFVAEHLATYRDFPPRQKPGTFSIERALSQLEQGTGH